MTEGLRNDVVDEVGARGRSSLKALEGQSFDVLVIGGGANGSSTAQHLAADGFRVLLIDKGDFGSGSSSRSSRLLGNGMHYLAGGHSPWDFILKPRRFLSGCRMARFALSSRAQMVKTVPELLEKVKFCFPLYKDSIYQPWQFDAGINVLKLLGTGGVDLGYQRISSAEARRRPLLKWLREPDKIASVATFDYFQFRWPERIVVDTALGAEKLGATIRNYTEAVSLKRVEDQRWHVVLRDGVDGTKVEVNAKIVMNMAGIWIDQVNGRSTSAKVTRKITGTKGIHIAFRLPPECKGASVTWQNRHNEHMYVLPWHDHHYVGPTEVPYEGNLDDIHPTESEIAWVIDEVRYMLPEMPLRREDVLYAWAGVRPWTSGPNAPKGLRERVLHDLSDEGMPGVMALTGGPLMSHRSAGADASAAVARMLKPSGPARQIDYSSNRFKDDGTSPALINSEPRISVAEIRHAAAAEHPVTLTDLLFRRVPAGWTERMGLQLATNAAEAVADIMGWDESRVAAEIDGFRKHVQHVHLHAE
jgi:glycerol-3-phosphate dehydrogenase